VTAPCTCGSWLWNDIMRPNDKRSPHWSSDFDHITAVDNRHVIPHQSAKYYPNRTTLNRKNDVMSIFKMADLSHLGF